MTMQEKLYDKLRDVAVKVGFGTALDFLMEHTRECVCFYNTEGDVAEEVGGSRMGGMPDLPDGFDWPKGWDEEKNPCDADFLAQFNLAEIPAIEGFPLPREGHIWLFMRSLWDTQGVVHVAGAYDGRPHLPLRRRTVADPKWALGDLTDGATALRFEPDVSLPFGNRGFRGRLHEIVTEDWGNLHDALYPDRPQGRIGGFAYTWEGEDLSREIALTRMGKRAYREGDRLLRSTLFDKKASMPYTPVRHDPYFESKRAEIEWIIEHEPEIVAATRSWRLLMQLRTNLKVNFCLGDSHPLWIFVNEQDLAGGDFGNMAAEAGS